MARPKKTSRHKVKTSITLEPELFDWIQSKVELKEFANITHAVEKGLLLLRDKIDRKNQ